MKIEVIRLPHGAPSRPIAAEFDEMGGSIGRSEGNTLVLPDEKRYISRTQASISFRAGSYVLRDLGSATPTLVSGTPVGNGNEIALRGGEEIAIGDYVLAVSLTPGASLSSADPFADLLPPSVPPPRTREHELPPVQRADDPFDNLFDAPVTPRGTSAQPASAIPQDFDPFADLLPPQPALTREQNGNVFDAGPASNENLDDLFSLRAPGNWDPLAPTQDPLGDPAAADPLAAFAPPPQRPSTQRDDAPMLAAAFTPPLPRKERAPAQPQRPAPRDSAPPPAAPDGAVVSWEQSPAAAAGGEIQSLVVPAPRYPGPGAGQRPPQRPQQTPVRAPPEAAAMPASPPAAAPAAPAAPAVLADSTPTSSEERDALLQAFLSGAGVADLKLSDGVTPDLMKLLGELIRETIAGTLDLLLARALTKREVRARATVIVARENNPLKFSPNVETALKHLLTPHGPEFMGAARAVHDAYNDLRSHQFGFMAGMRAALEGVLARFDPAHLEQRLAQKGVLGTLVPSTRRAALWELYEQLYRQISREAEDDFHTLFGREFLRAYEAQIAKLEQEDAARR